MKTKSTEQEQWDKRIPAPRTEPEITDEQLAEADEDDQLGVQRLGLMESLKGTLSSLIATYQRLLTWESRQSQPSEEKMAAWQERKNAVIDEDAKTARHFSQLATLVALNQAYSAELRDQLAEEERLIAAVTAEKKIRSSRSANGRELSL